MSERPRQSRGRAFAREGALVARTAALTAALWAAPRAAAAQSDEELVARRLALSSAEEAQRNGDHQQALELAQRAGAIQMTPSVRHFLAQELVALGRHAEALVHAQTCLREVEHTPAVANRDSLIEHCRALSAEARAHVGMVLLTPPTPAIAGLTVTVNGHELRGSLLGLPHFVDQGTVQIVAEAPGRTPFRRTIEMTVNGSARVAIELPVPSADVVPTPPMPLLPPTRPARRPATPPRLVPGAVALWGVGGAALISAGVTLALRQSAVGACPGEQRGDELVGQCPNDDALRAARATPALGVATGVLAGVGVGAIVGGAVWWTLARSARRDTEVSVEPGPDRAGISVLRRF